MTTLDARIKEVFADAFELTPDEISDDLSVENCANWDSLRSITLSFSLEQAFNVEFTDRELMKIESYSAIRDLLISKGVS
jgi:acyl carrier protein